jgi:hypothetical protein
MWRVIMAVQDSGCRVQGSSSGFTVRFKVRCSEFSVQAGDLIVAAQSSRTAAPPEPQPRTLNPER